MQRNEETLMRTYGGIEVTKKCKDCQIKRLDFVEKSNLVETNCRVFFFFRKQQIISSVEFAHTWDENMHQEKKIVHGKFFDFFSLEVPEPRVRKRPY